MTIPTVAITCVAADQNGNAMKNCEFKAQLAVTEIYNGFVVPTTISAITDETGTAILRLWPNALGVNGSTYLIVGVVLITGHIFLQSNVTVPNADCFLSNIITDAPYPTVDAAAQALVATQAALAVAIQQADLATASAASFAVALAQVASDLVATQAVVASLLPN